MSKLKVFLSLLTVFLPPVIVIVFFPEKTGLLFFSFFLSGLLPYFVYLWQTPEQKWRNYGETILGSLYAPEEILDQTDSQEIQNWIKIFQNLGYENIAKEYTCYLKDSSYQLQNLPAPEEIQAEFMTKFMKIDKKGLEKVL